MKRFCAYKMIEFYHVGLALWWGVCLTMPYDTFQLEVYASMANLAPDYVWGLFAFGIASGQILAMYGRFKRFLPMGLALASFYWTFIGVMFIVNDIQSKTLTTGSGSYLLVSAMILWLSFNIGGEEK